MAKKGAQEKINDQELLELLKFYPTVKEAADWFDVSMSTLERFIKTNHHETFDSLRDKRFVKTKVAIKRAQIKKALTGDNTMLIWVGKQYLGQRDSFEEIHHETETKENLVPSMTKEQALEEIKKRQKKS